MPSRTRTTVRRGRGPGPGGRRVLGPRLRGGDAARADGGDGDQPAQPLRRLREQGGAVPQGPRPLPDRPPVVPGRGPEGADRPGRGGGDLLGLHPDAARAGPGRGCLVVSGALACGEEARAGPPGAGPVAAGDWSRHLRDRFERAVRERDLPAGTDCATLARYVATVLHGLAVQSASGATEAELRRVAAVAMRALARPDGIPAAASRPASRSDAAGLGRQQAVAANDKIDLAPPPCGQPSASSPFSIPSPTRPPAAGVQSTRTRRRPRHTRDNRFMRSNHSSRRGAKLRAFFAFAFDAPRSFVP